MKSFHQWMLQENNNNLNQIVENFLKSEIGIQNQKNDCKTVARAFVKWAKQNGIKADVLLLAPPSAETIKNRPELKGKSGEGDSHIMPVVDGNAIDFTVRQFPAQRGRPYDKPLITPIGNVEKVYKQIGGYYTDAPEYFGTGTPYYLGPWSGMPSFFNKNFSDELM